MRLVTGGAYQGKLDFALTLLKKRSKPEIVDGTVLDGQPADIVTHLHLYIKTLLEQGLAPEQVTARVMAYAEAYPDVILIVNELGCGIVPMDAFDRRWRELVGRISCNLAQRAEAVYRVNCGIGMKLK